MDKRLLNLGVCSYLLLSMASFQILMSFWYLSDYDLSSFPLFMASIGTRIILLGIGIVCYRKYRKKLKEDPDDGKLIMTSQAVQWTGGWIILALILQPFSFVLYMNLNQLNQFTKPNMLFLLLYAPFIAIAVFHIKKSYPGGDSGPVPEYVKRLCFAVLSCYLFFPNFCEILQAIITKYRFMTPLSPYDIKWFSAQFIFIGASLVLLFLAYKNMKSHNKQYEIDLLSQSLITGGSLILIHDISGALNFAFQSLTTWLLLIIGVCFIMIGNRKRATNGNEKEVL